MAHPKVPAYFRFVLAAALGVCSLASSAQDPAGSPAAATPAAQVAPPAPAPPPTINYRERPRFPFDPQRLRLRPTIDGVIGENEWTPLYTADKPVAGTIYVNWDEDFLYVAARADQPAWFVIDLDCNGDGWLRGADNLEIVVPPLSATGGALAARILDAASNKDAPVWNDRVADPKSIQYVLKEAGTGQVVEMAIPRGLAGLTPRLNAQLSFRADFLPASAGPPVATAPYEPHLLVDISLVASRAVGAPGLAPRLTLEAAQVVPGQALVASFDISNQVDEERRVRSITWQGEGAAADYVKTLREVNIPPIKGMKTLRSRFRSELPDTAVPGFYQFTARANLDNGAEVVSTASFAVVEAYKLLLTAEPANVTVLGPVPVRLTAEVTCSVPGFAHADLELEAPAGWEIKGRARKPISSRNGPSEQRIQYFVTVPSSTQAGEYIVHVTLTWKGKSWTAHRTVKVNRPADPAPSK